VPPTQKHVCQTLKCFQQIAGWVNWSLNVFPLPKPALSNVYEKTSGKDNPHAGIFVNQAIICDLLWFLDHLSCSSGILLIETHVWEPKNANLVAYCNPSLEGLGFHFPALSIGCQSSLLTHGPTGNILYLKALCIYWAIKYAESQGFQGKLLVFTDSNNSYNIFNTLCVKPLYNEIVKATVDILLHTKIQLWVTWIDGKTNVVADALSCWRNEVVFNMCPDLCIDPFPTPNIHFSSPHPSLGCAKKWLPSPPHPSNHIDCHGHLIIWSMIGQ
jgi:hypothetical protein